ncbi:hypothetical protein GCM10009647_075270 [Streptomyces sanglieri]
MSNPFDDLEADDTSTDDDPVEGDKASVDEPGIEDSSETVAETTAEPSSSTVDSNPSSVNQSDTTSSEAGPAFEYSAVRQRPLYARGETWDELEDELGITVTPELRRMGIRDEETREIHDAILKIAIEHSDEIPDQIGAERQS